jgi:hypothetical protein
MQDWRKAYAARDWDKVENWWRHSEDKEELCALLAQLQRDVPHQLQVNGMEERTEYVHPRDAPAEWKGAAKILFMGELEAKALGGPEPELEEWKKLCIRIRSILQNMLAEAKEPTTGDPTMSRAAHAREAMAFLDQVERESLWMQAQIDPEGDNSVGREWLQAVIAQAAQAAFWAGIHTRAADTKEFEAHSVRGKKVLAGAKTGAAWLRRSHAETTARILRSMDDYVAFSFSVARAAALTFQNHLGTSAAANRKLYTRHRQSKKVGTVPPMSQPDRVK